MSAEAVGWTWKYSPYSGAGLLVHLALADAANDMNDNELWASQAYISRKSRVTRPRVNEWLKLAVEEGYLELVEDHSQERKPNRYRLLMPSAATQVWSAKSHVPTEDMSPSHVPTKNMNMFSQGTSHVLSGNTNPIEPKIEPKLSDPSSYEKDNTSPSDSVRVENDVREQIQNDYDKERSNQGSAPASHQSSTMSEDAKPPSPAKVVFDAWVEIMGKDPARTKLTDARRQKINARLRSEFEVPDLIDAIRGARGNTWMMGANDRSTVFDDIVTIFKNDEAVNRHAKFFRDGCPNGKTKGTTNQTKYQSDMDRLDAAIAAERKAS